MIKSMTAFGRAKLESESRDITIEMKSVNSRFFDCTVKLPRSISYLEEKIKAYVTQFTLELCSAKGSHTLNHLLPPHDVFTEERFF